jgi:hypothetical protein
MRPSAGPVAVLRRLALSVAIVAGLSGCGAPAARSQAAPLELERTIVLKDVAGRIDHLALDPVRRRLFVAELGNGTVDAVDLDSGTVAGRISGLREPQGLAFLPDRDELAVASGGDGTVRFYRGADLARAGSIALGGDADNLRVEAQTGRLFAGYGAARWRRSTRRPAPSCAGPPCPRTRRASSWTPAALREPAGRPDRDGGPASSRERAAWPNAGLAFN